MSDGADVYRLVYRSRSALTGSDAAIASELNAIMEQSAKNNERSGVTGALMFTASIFIQILEGSAADLEQTFERICCDTRHIGVELMSFSSVPARLFGEWSLRRVHADATMEALLRHLSGAATPEGGAASILKQALDRMHALALEPYADPLTPPQTPDLAARVSAPAHK